MIEKQKAEDMAAKRRKAKRRISLSSEEKDESDTREDTDLDQANRN